MKKNKKDDKAKKVDKVIVSDKKGKDDKKHKDDASKNKKKPKNFNYFDSLVSFTHYSNEAAILLNSILHNYDPSKLEMQMKEMHAIEHAADLAKHDMMSHLVKEFITPIDREDISAIGQEIDNVTDTLEDVLMQLYMYNVQTIHAEALEFSETILACCDALTVAMEDFANYKKSTAIMKNIININNMEEAGDRIYTRAMRKLYTTCTDPIEVMAWTKCFDYLEKCCDACETVADAMESIIMKNS